MRTRMEDPKVQAWMYVIVGALAVAGGAFFVAMEAGFLDWLILGLGIFSVGRGVRDLWNLRSKA